MVFAVITFGSNDQPVINLIKALKALKQQVNVLSISPVYENPAVKIENSPAYFNGACLIETNLSPDVLCEQVLYGIETNLGRLRGKEGKVKCSIDLDLVLYDEKVLLTPVIELPAPDILKYAYAAVPLGVLVPDWIHPITKQTMAEIAREFCQEKAKFFHRVEIDAMLIKELFNEKLSTQQPVVGWHWRKLPLSKRSGSQVFQALFLNGKNSEIATLLESPNTEESPLARYSICAGSPRCAEGICKIWTPAVGEILPFLRGLLNCKKSQEMPSILPPELPFTGGWLGWLGYDLAWEIEILPHFNEDSLPFPVAFWYEPEYFAVLDHKEQVLWLAASDLTKLDVMEKNLENAASKTLILSSQAEEGVVEPSFKMSQTEYEEAVRQAKKYIQAGDIFQTNLSLRFELETSFDSWAIYQALQHINPSPFASYWQTPWGAIISCSPERLIQLTGKKVETRPIAGTRRRGATPAEDVALAQELLSNIKERAEHIMLVDLERNDIGRVCEWGSVKVDEFLTIERYSHVMHLVSNVVGNLRENYDAIDLIKAVFPGGTITGCPKVRCMEIIEELEPVKRNLFYGSCGYLDWRGNLDLNIFIRTLLYSKNVNSQGAKVWGQVGAGIVADSDPEKEWKESLQKAQAQLNALKLAANFQ